jgi:hypothetical protein
MAARPRWPTIVALLFGAAVSASAPAAGPGTNVLVRDERGTILARVSLPDDGRLTLRYRNSLYGSLVEERFIAEDYEIDGAPERTAAGDTRAWRAPPRRHLALERLAVAASDLGERVLLVPGRTPIELWRLVDDEEPTVLITLDSLG